MGKSNLSVDVNVAGIDKIETLLSLLNKHKESLPEELVESLMDLADCDECEIDSQYIAGAGHVAGDVKCFVDGRLSPASGVVSANLILKRLTIYPSRYYGESEYPELNAAGDAYEERYIYPESLLIKSGDGETIASWGC
jgi:hypothetical protein